MLTQECFPFFIVKTLQPWDFSIIYPFFPNHNASDSAGGTSSSLHLAECPDMKACLLHMLDHVPLLTQMRSPGSFEAQHQLLASARFAKILKRELSRSSRVGRLTQKLTNHHLSGKKIHEILARIIGYMKLLDSVRALRTAECRMQMTRRSNALIGSWSTGALLS